MTSRHPQTNPPAPKVCGECGRKFYGSPKARWCSDSCKMRAYRRRKNVTANK